MPYEISFDFIEIRLNAKVKYSNYLYKLVSREIGLILDSALYLIILLGINLKT
jgi:hypothetical protein